MALHRAAAKVVACGDCGIQFCPLYRAMRMVCCPDCQEERSREHYRVQKRTRRARIKGVDYESVSPKRVFARDGWKCQACGVPTPPEKRGTYDPDAPELDHVIPLSRGGPHTYANTQCLCRACNAAKSDLVHDRGMAGVPEGVLDG